MAKKRKPKYVSSAKSASAQPAPNMFETLWSRRKFDILGKKQKGEGKRVGQLRSRAIEKRKKTILEEYKRRNKNNTFVDRRFGENDEQMSDDEKAILRFQRERQAQLQRKNKFALPDVEDEEGEILTHKGAALSVLDDFNDDISGDDDEPGELDERTVRELNFGGGLPEAGENKKEHKTKKEVMEEIIFKSKHFKALKAKEKEEDMDLREKLDKDFRVLSETPALLSLIRPKKQNVLNSLMAKVSSKDSGKGKDDVPETKAEKEKPDEYDKLMKEMVFEMRAHASDRLKTSEELAKEERERLEELEKRRIQRMTGQESDSENDKSDEEDGGLRRRKRKNRAEISGDDLGENFVLEDEYQEKGWVDEVLARRGGESPASSDADEDDEADSEGEDCEDEDGEDTGLQRNDVASSGSEDFSDDEDALEATTSTDPDTGPTEDQIEATETTELPFIINAPKSLEEFKRLVRNRSIPELETAIQRIRTCNAISLAAENRKKMQIFYNVLLLYFSEVAGSKPFSLAKINLLTKSLIEMSSETPYFAAVCARERLIRMHKLLSEKLRNRDDSSCWPSVRTLLLMRLWSLIFPASDFRHAVMTPLMLLMGEYLLRCPVRSGRDVAVGSFICSLALSTMRHARRFCPEALSFLLTLLSTGLTDNSLARKNCPQFLMELLGSQPWLRLKNKVASLEPLDFVSLMSAEDNSGVFDTDTFRTGIINASLQTLKGFVTIYSDLPSCPEIFRQFLPVLLELSISNQLPASLKTSLADAVKLIKQTVEDLEKFRQPLQMRLRKPTPIKQFNPKFEEDFVKGRDYDIDRDRAERKKLRRQVKREAKGAARELRKDNQFLAAEKSKERAEAEAERAEKYKKAMAFLEEQESAAKSGQLGRKKRRHNK